ncbi:hypothetical protein PR048_018955 [Dryococelus australis]|uniref:Uncharacterized protein n=1 Tax=Dryococelus australis TaxID=614101 RepID=A0ABQ9H2G9_9NEOP|nr:hypothetical protein PR048_018955 [Dryococelus australis]
MTRTSTATNIGRSRPFPVRAPTGRTFPPHSLRPVCSHSQYSVAQRDYCLASFTERSSTFLAQDTETAPRRASFRPPLVSPPPPEQTRDRDSHESARATRRRRARTQLTSLSAGPPSHPRSFRSSFIFSFLLLLLFLSSVLLLSFSVLPNYFPLLFLLFLFIVPFPPPPLNSSCIHFTSWVPLYNFFVFGAFQFFFPTVTLQNFNSSQTTRLPPTKTALDFRRGRSRIFACRNRAGRCLRSAVLGDPQFPAPLHSGAAPYPPHFTLIGSQNLNKSCPPNLSTPFQLLGGGTSWQRQKQNRTERIKMAPVPIKIPLPPPLNPHLTILSGDRGADGGCHFSDVSVVCLIEERRRNARVRETKLPEKTRPAAASPVPLCQAPRKRKVKCYSFQQCKGLNCRVERRCSARDTWVCERRKGRGRKSSGHFPARHARFETSAVRAGLRESGAVHTLDMRYYTHLAGCAQPISVSQHLTAWLQMRLACVSRNPSSVRPEQFHERPEKRAFKSAHFTVNRPIPVYQMSYARQRALSAWLEEFRGIWSLSTAAPNLARSTLLKARSASFMDHPLTHGAVNYCVRNYERKLRWAIIWLRALEKCIPDVTSHCRCPQQGHIVHPRKSPSAKGTNVSQSTSERERDRTVRSEGHEGGRVKYLPGHIERASGRSAVAMTTSHSPTAPALIGRPRDLSHYKTHLPGGHGTSRCPGQAFTMHNLFTVNSALFNGPIEIAVSHTHCRERLRSVMGGQAGMTASEHPGVNNLATGRRTAVMAIVASLHCDGACPLQRLTKEYVTLSEDCEASWAADERRDELEEGGGGEVRNNFDFVSPRLKTSA